MKQKMLDIHCNVLQVFDRIRTESPALFSKIVSLHGDVSETDLGLNEEDRRRVVTEVNVVFHAAATIRFNESLKFAVTLNTLGTQRVIQLCKNIHNLQVLFFCSVQIFSSVRSIQIY
jgi:fatty acyl-CoA reductase